MWFNDNVKAYTRVTFNSVNFNLFVQIYTILELLYNQLRIVKGLPA